MELERVGTISVGDLVLESFGEVDDLDGLVGAALYAHTATDAEVFGDKANFIGLGDLDAELASFVYRTGLGAFERALLGLALVGVDNRNTELFGVHSN